MLEERDPKVRFQRANADSTHSSKEPWDPRQRGLKERPGLSLICLEAEGYVFEPSPWTRGSPAGRSLSLESPRIREGMRLPQTRSPGFRVLPVVEPGGPLNGGAAG